MFLISKSEKEREKNRKREAGRKIFIYMKKKITRRRKNFLFFLPKTSKK